MTRKSNPPVTRRFFLQGSGAIIALPYFASLLPRGARAAVSNIETRYLSYFVPNGMLAQYWKPAAVGANYTLPAKAVLAPLAEHRSRFTIVSGTRNKPTGRLPGGGHGQGGASANTGMPNAGVNQPKKAGISADQIVARARPRAGRLASLQLGMPGELGISDLGLAQEYEGSISWANTATNMPPTSDRNAVLKDLFPSGTVTGDGTSAVTGAEDPAARTELARRRRSILDASVAQAKSLQRDMGVEDRARMEQFLTGIREVEASLQSDQLGASCAPLGAMRATNDLDTIYDQWDQIITTAFQCDRTSVISFMFAAGQSFRHYPNIGVNQEHHLLSHYASDFKDNNTGPRIEQLRQIQVYEMTRFAALLSSLQRVAEGMGTLLDNTVIVLFSEMSESNGHGFDDMPVLVAGGGGGRIVSNGSHLRSNNNVEFAQVLLASIRAAGVEVGSLGASQEAQSFPGLLAPS